MSTKKNTYKKAATKKVASSTEPIMDKPKAEPKLRAEKKPKPKSEKPKVEKTLGASRTSEQVTAEAQGENTKRPFVSVDLRDPEPGSTAWNTLQHKRRVQAYALWKMYHDGELEKQTIQYHGKSHYIEKVVLYSHHSIYAV